MNDARFKPDGFNTVDMLVKYPPNIYYTDVEWDVNYDHVFVASNEFGEFLYILSDTFENAWEAMLEWMEDRESRAYHCDHGGDIDDGIRALEIMGERDSTCDCEMSPHGEFMWTVHVQMKQLALPTEMFLLAHGEDVEGIAR